MRTEVLPFMFRDWYAISSHILLVVVCLFFFLLPAASRKKNSNLLPFLYALSILLMDRIGFGLRVFQDFNGAVNGYLGNSEKPLYNAWSYNIGLRMALPVVAMLLIRVYIPIKQKSIVNKVLIGFAIFVCIYQILQIEPIYLNQGILFAVGALCILTSCFIYFYTLMTNEEYLEKNLLLLPSFWQVTMIMFYTSLVYFNDISMTYLYEKNRALLLSNLEMSKIISLVQSIIFILCIAAPTLRIKLENQPNNA